MHIYAHRTGKAYEGASENRRTIFTNAMCAAIRSTSSIIGPTSDSAKSSYAISSRSVKDAMAICTPGCDKSTAGCSRPQRKCALLGEAMHHQ
jgi:hypothetical protein